MSRSYKKTPYAGDHTGRIFKKFFNRSIRRKKLNDDVPPKSNIHKKKKPSWDISDYGGICTFQQYWEFELAYWRKRVSTDPDYPKPDKRKCYYEWLKYYKSK